MRFEWTEAKRESNIRKHGIDFVDAVLIFDAPHFIFRSDRHHEERYGATGDLNGRIIALFFHDREGGRRIISARRARTNEEKDYRDSIK